MVLERPGGQLMGLGGGVRQVMGRDEEIAGALCKNGVEIKDAEA